MNPEIKAQWLTALRSGDYKQGSGCLRSIDDEYCCLGVLLAIYDNSKWTQDPMCPNYLYLNIEGSLPLDIAAEIKLANEEQAKLIQFNDVENLTFNQIADWAESNL